MLEYTPEEKNVGLFNISKLSTETRAKSKEELNYDIPKSISEFGGEISVENFKNKIYNNLPQHTLMI